MNSVRYIFPGATTSLEECCPTEVLGRYPSFHIFRSGSNIPQDGGGGFQITDVWWLGGAFSHFLFGIMYKQYELPISCFSCARYSSTVPYLISRKDGMKYG